MKILAAFSLVLVLGACVAAPGPQGGALPPEPLYRDGGPDTGLPDPETAARNFSQVVMRMRPVIARECRARLPAEECDFRIGVDDRSDVQANAFQTRDSAGRPILIFTLPLIAEMRNQDEIAFVMGHEAAHHILRHLDRQQRDAVAGAVITSVLAGLAGGTAADIQQAQEAGAVLGSRRYAKNYELQADELGAIIAFHAGYDPLHGAEFFARLPDPGNRFLGTHPPNASRMLTVQRTMSGMQAYSDLCDGPRRATCS